jgi:hypothetical protein
MWDGVFGQEEQEFEDKKRKGTERNDFEYSEDVVLEFEENGENDPFGAELFEFFGVRFGGLKLENDPVDQDDVTDDSQHCRCKVVKWHLCRFYIIMKTKLKISSK